MLMTFNMADAKPMKTPTHMCEPFNEGMNGKKIDKTIY